ncbi:hypothetical protein ATCC90586_007625 [Pythium insidiosum]|nr:hypothetical protein ATCC90586_007625 [Pythium insidiosum]
MATANTASPVIRLPAAAWKVMDAALETKCTTFEELGDEHVQVCDKDVWLPTLGFVFGDKTFYVAPEHYTAPLASYPKKVAVLVVEEFLEPTTWTLGAPFFRAFHSSFSTIPRAMTLYCEQGETCVDGAIPKKDPIQEGGVMTGNNSRRNVPTHLPARGDFKVTSQPDDISASSGTVSSQNSSNTAILIAIPVVLTVICVALLLLARHKKKRKPIHQRNPPATARATTFGLAETPGWPPSAPPESPNELTPTAQLVPSAIPASALQVVHVIPSAPDAPDVL